MICFPNAKINLGLHIINERPDGFHNIETVFYPIPLCDMLEAVKVDGKPAGKIEFLSEGLTIKGDSDNNLVVKAYREMDKAFNLPPVRFFLYKKIPMGAGLGGGSSDAAFCIRLLDQLFELRLSTEQMYDFASRLGSDCAFFIGNKPAYAFGKGHELENMPLDLDKYFLVLLYPGIHSDTATAYRNVIKRGILHENTSLKRLPELPPESWKETVSNDFEKSLFEIYPEIRRMKEALYDCGAVYASMTGSGSAVFGIFEKMPEIPPHLVKWVCYTGKMR